MTESSAADGSRTQGRLELALEDRRGITRPVRALALPPVQLSRVRYDSPRAPGRAVFTLLHLGGVLAGDRAQMHVRLAPGAEAELHMAAATQVLQMPAGDAAHMIELRLGAGSRLAWLAQPLILFAGARFSQNTRVFLAPGARLALLEVLVPGRLARGERYAFASYEARLEVCDETGRCLVAERALLEPGRLPLGVPGALADTPVLGSLYLLGDAPGADRLASALHDPADRNLGVSALPNGAGVLVRALGATPSQVHRRLLAIYAATSLSTADTAA